MDDVDRFVEIVASAIETATAPLLARIAALERQKAISPRDGRDGKDGTSLNVADFSVVISAEVQTVFRSMLPALKSACLAEIPQPKDGAPGLRGERGQDAPAPDMDAIVTRVLALVPPPERGQKGDAGDRGHEGPMGPAGPAGDRGEQGLVGRAGSQIVTGNGTPTKDGNQGDFYIDLSSGEIYQWFLA